MNTQGEDNEILFPNDIFSYSIPISTGLLTVSHHSSIVVSRVLA